MEVEHHIHPGEDRAACGGSTVFPSHTALVGTPDEVIEQIEFNRDLIGEHEPFMQINFGAGALRHARDAALPNVCWGMMIRCLRSG
jgi:alkanesulfonate monooxygenase SsuD/methylene tetrahydromethanopterin reductase-like flavin-dependent oxidoreductase (luciferase family)